MISNQSCYPLGLLPTFIFVCMWNISIRILLYIEVCIKFCTYFLILNLHFFLLTQFIMAVVGVWSHCVLWPRIPFLLGLINRSGTVSQRLYNSLLEVPWPYSRIPWTCIVILPLGLATAPYGIFSHHLTPPTS